MTFEILCMKNPFISCFPSFLYFSIYMAWLLPYVQNSISQVFYGCLMWDAPPSLKKYPQKSHPQVFVSILEKVCNVSSAMLIWHIHFHLPHNDVVQFSVCCMCCQLFYKFRTLYLLLRVKTEDKAQLHQIHSKKHVGLIIADALVAGKRHFYPNLTLEMAIRMVWKYYSAQIKLMLAYKTNHITEIL